MWVQKVHQWRTAVGADNNLVSLYSAPQPVCCHDASQSVCSQQSCLVSYSTMLVV